MYTIERLLSLPIKHLIKKIVLIKVSNYKNVKTNINLL